MTVRITLILYSALRGMNWTELDGLAHRTGAF